MSEHGLNYRYWFLAAALYNLLWGTWVVLQPEALFDVLNIAAPDQLAIWQSVGMCVLVFAPGYWWASRDPYRFRHYILLGFIGKLFGVTGFIWSFSTGLLPWQFGITIVANDLVWLPAFWLFLSRVSVYSGGWHGLVSGD